jgi:hypothetical protein
VSSTKESISCGVGLARKPRVAFLDSEQRLGDGGLYRSDRKGLQYVRSTEERTGLVLAWVGVLMQITTICHANQVIQDTLSTFNNQGARFATYGGISKLITYVRPPIPEYTLHRTLHASSAATCKVVDSGRAVQCLCTYPACGLWKQSLTFATVRAPAATNA